jgi:ribosomal protein S12 methylthiotransferase
MKKIFLQTLGCPKNIADSEILLNQLKKNNLDLVKSPESANIVLVNTCGFINDAKEESLEFIFDMIDLKRKGIIEKIIVLGCLSERYGNELKDGLPEVDAFYGVDNFDSILKSLGGKSLGKELYKHAMITPPHYAYVKISDGCNHKCSFCAIPSFKGNYKSKKIQDIVNEIEGLPKTIKEVNLVAQDITYYGKDLYKENKLGALLRKISKSDFKSWIRLLYCYPSKFPFEILDIILENDNFCNYLDLPIQHVSDVILKSMRRGITKKNLEILIDKIRNKIPDMALRTSIIVGYPGETTKEFKELLSFIDKIKFDRLGVFTYSPEEGTHAYSLKNNVKESEKNRRKEILLELQKEISNAKNAKKIGSALKVLLDDEDSSYFFGRSEYDAPEIDNMVLVKKTKSMKCRVGDFINVKIIDSSDFDLYAKILKN